MTERTRLRLQAAEMGFLRRVAGFSLRDRVRSSVIREGLGVQPLLLHVERSQLRWFGHLVRIPPGHLSLRFFFKEAELFYIETNVKSSKTACLSESR